MRARTCSVLTLAAALVSAGPLFAGGSAEQPKAGGITVAIVLRSFDEFYGGIQQGGLAAANDIGNVDLLSQGPDKPSAEGQAQIVTDLINQKVNAIAISPDEGSSALNVAVKKAIDAGIKVVSFDGKLAPGGPLLEVSSASDETVGRTLARMMAQQIGDSGEIGIISSSPEAAYQNSLIEAMKKELAAHPNIHLDAVLYGNDRPDRSARETATLLKAYPRVKGIISPTTVGLPAVGKALEDAGLSGKVQMTGLGVPADMKPYFDSGTCGQMLLGIPADVGYAVTCVAAELARGQARGTPGETLKVGRLGTLVVDPTMTATLTQPSVVTPDTIGAFE